MVRIATNRWIPLWIAAVLVGAGCVAAPSPRPTSPPATTTPATSQAPTATPSAAAVSTPKPTPVATASRPPAAWLEVPPQDSVSGVQFEDVVWTGTRFVATGGGVDEVGTFLDSPDGIKWHRQTNAGKGWSPNRLAAGPGGVVAVGLIGGHAASWFSADGLTWVVRRDAFPMPTVGTDEIEVADVVARGDGWLAVGHQDPVCYIDCGSDPSRAYVWTSNDGSRWTRLPNQEALNGGGMVAVAHGDGRFAAVGTAAGHAAIWTSPDGLAWSRVPDFPRFHGLKVEGGALPASARGVAIGNGVIVVVGGVFGQDYTEVRAWWSTTGQTWAMATVEKPAEGQAFSVAATPDGFLATGPSGPSSCRGGIWASTSGRIWRCDASQPKFEGFGPYAAAASDTIEVAVGLTSKGYDESSGDGLPGAAWTRAIR